MVPVYLPALLRSKVPFRCALAVSVETREGTPRIPRTARTSASVSKSDMGRLKSTETPAAASVKEATRIASLILMPFRGFGGSSLSRLCRKRAMLVTVESVSLVASVTRSTGVMIEAESHLL